MENGFLFASNVLLKIINSTFFSFLVTPTAPPLCSSSGFHCGDTNTRVSYWYRMRQTSLKMKMRMIKLAFTHRQYIPPEVSPTARLLYSEPPEGGAVWTRGCTDSGWWSWQDTPPSWCQTCGHSPPRAEHHRTLRTRTRGHRASYQTTCRLMCLGQQPSPSPGVECSRTNQCSDETVTCDMKLFGLFCITWIPTFILKALINSSYAPSSAIDRQWAEVKCFGLKQHTWPFLAGERQVVVAGHVVPLAVLVPDHHHAVFSRVEVVIRLVRPPVLILLRKKTE